MLSGLGWENQGVRKPSVSFIRGNAEFEEYLIAERDLHDHLRLFEL